MFTCKNVIIVAHGNSLRAIMMLLGLVLHSAITYQVVNQISTWPLKDPITHISHDYIVSFIHTFRMQIFFLIAGFFGSMLFYERRSLAMIKNRVERIAFPFIVFLFLLWPLVVFAFGSSRLLIAGHHDILEMADNVSEDTRKMIQQHQVSIKHVNVGHGAGTFNLALDIALKLSDSL